MTYPQTTQYLESFINYEKIPAYPYKESIKLNRIKGFLSSIGNPQHTLRCLHIAGTKGKGSTCAFIAYILREAGFRVGLYTSPHLVNFRERIRILEPSASKASQQAEFEGMIPPRHLSMWVGRIKPYIETFNGQSGYGPLSFFEVYTALAFLYFKERNVDLAVLETGLGGRLDATNTVDSLVAVITPISYEHTQKLGNTLTAIAQEKAGIIKSQDVTIKNQNPTVITAPQEKEALKVIQERSAAVGAMLYEVGRDITYKRTKKDCLIRGLFDTYAQLKLRLLGEHQLINAATAVGAVEALRVHGIRIGADAIRTGLMHTLWPGRCEVIRRNPLIVLDGAQNVASSIALKKTIKEQFTYKKLILVFGISLDKDIRGVCEVLYDVADEIIVTKANNPRASQPKELVGYFKGKNVYVTDTVREAKTCLRRLARKKDMVLVCGSLFVVGEFRNGKG